MDVLCCMGNINAIQKFISLKLCLSFIIDNVLMIIWIIASLCLYIDIIMWSVQRFVYFDGGYNYLRICSSSACVKYTCKMYSVILMENTPIWKNNQFCFAFICWTGFVFYFLMCYFFSIFIYFESVKIMSHVSSCKKINWWVISLPS